MRNIFKISLTLCAFLVMSSCQDFLEPTPTDFIDATKAYETIGDAEQGLFGAYLSYTSTALILNTSRLANNLRVGGGNNGQGIFIHGWGYNSADGTVDGQWRSRYNAILRANDVLENIDGVSDGTDAEKNQIRGEALALRAWGHFDLVRFFADAYTVNPSGQGIPYKLPPNNVLTEDPRVSVSEVYTNIVNDLTQAKSLISADANDITRVTATACDAFLAQVYLTMGDWQNAVNHANAAISSGPALATGSDYINMFAADDPAEVIFKIKMTGDNAAIGQSYWDPTTGINFFAVADDVTTLYSGGDIRTATTYSSSAAAGENIVVKYPGLVGQTPGLNDLKILRTSDMYLIRAEATWRLNGGGLDDLNAVRAARNADQGSESGQTLLDAIWTERRKELMYEGSWWFDLKRTNQDCVRGADCNSGECTLSAGDYRWNFPIPEDEMLANGNMVQNNGY